MQVWVSKQISSSCVAFPPLFSMEDTTQRVLGKTVFFKGTFCFNHILFPKFSRIDALYMPKHKEKKMRLNSSFDFIMKKPQEQ